MKFMFILGYFGKSYPLTPGNLQLENLDNWAIPRVWSIHFSTKDPVTVATGQPLFCGGVLSAPCRPLLSTGTLLAFQQGQVHGRPSANPELLVHSDFCLNLLVSMVETRQMCQGARNIWRVLPSGSGWQEPLFQDRCPPFPQQPAKSHFQAKDEWHCYSRAMF